MKRVLLLTLVAVLLVAGGWWFLGRAQRTNPSSRATRASVVLVTIDTLRADRLGRGFTPNLDALAAVGERDLLARAVVPLTLPSHVSIMTGRVPYEHGVRENGVVFDRKTPTLARTFKDAGYKTAAFVGAYVLNRRFGLDEGFDTYNDEVRRDPNRPELLEAERPANDVVDAALRWLSDTREPFFLWVHVYDPHVPYAPPGEFLAKAGGNAYDGEVAFADAQVGRLIDALRARPDGAQTVIAVTGDHGEGLGEHGEDTHGMLAYDSTLRVPLIIADAAPLGDHPVSSTNDRATSLLDLHAKLLWKAGLRPVPESRPSYAETRYPRRAGWHALSALADDRWKLILSSEPELYDIAADPGEQQNVAGANPNVVQAMSAALAKMTANQAADAKASPEAAERLRALGYVSGSNAVTSDDPKAPNPAREIAAWGTFERALGDLQSDSASKALPSLKSLADRYPNASVFQATYAQALKAAGRAREAVVIYKSAVARWPNDATLFHDLAVAAREAGNTEEAMRAEQAALALDGTSAAALNGLGLLHADAGRASEAVAAFDRAVKADPTNASYWTNLGNARRGADDRAAEAAYRQALSLDATFPDALNGLGTLLVQSNRAADAIPLFLKALERDATLHEARLNLGIAYQEAGQHDKAATAYRDLLAKAPPSAARERQAATELLRQLK